MCLNSCHVDSDSFSLILPHVTLSPTYVVKTTDVSAITTVAKPSRVRVSHDYDIINLSRVHCAQEPASPFRVGCRVGRAE